MFTEDRSKLNLPRSYIFTLRCFSCFITSSSGILKIWCQLLTLPVWYLTEVDSLGAGFSLQRAMLNLRPCWRWESWKVTPWTPRQACFTALPHQRRTQPIKPPTLQVLSRRRRACLSRSKPDTIPAPPTLRHNCRANLRPANLPLPPLPSPPLPL